MIRLLPYDRIDKNSWDDCISRSPNALIYARSFFLDHMAPGWQGLVLGNYEAVMPITSRKKWGISYLYQPAFFQQGGIFSPDSISHDTAALFIRKAMEHFRFAEITLNFGNEMPGIPGLSSELRQNFILDLGRRYEELKSGFSDSFQKNLNRIKNMGLRYESSENENELVELYRTLYRRRLPYFRDSDYEHFAQLCAFLKTSGRLIIRKAIDKDGELLAAILLLQDENRLYNMISCLTDKGREKEGNYFLFDRLIMEFSNRKLTLDMEGSDIPGIADFYRRMSPAEQPYPFIRYDHLPWFIRLIRK